VRARNLAWALWAVAISLDLGAYVLFFAGRPGSPLYEFWVEGTFISPAFVTLGALIVSRRPGNVIGWIFLAAGVLGGVQMFCGQYATAALAPDGPALPAGALAGWLSTRAQQSAIISFLFLVLLFPTGRLLSPRWRLLAWAAGTVFATWVVSSAIMPGPQENFPSARNPFGVEAAAPILEVLEAIGGLGSLVLVVAMIISVILRFYRSRGEERLQLKWFAYAATLGFMAILLGGDRPFIGTLVWTLGPLSLPVAAGVAVLKYRLYDIDVIINRTLVYGLLTASLALVYVGSVFSLQYLFRTLTREPSQLVVVASTLAIAALFSPLRRRIQDAVDRRFYRRKYDAQKTLEAFSARLRDETDLETLGADLVAVARETVQPAHATLWLRTPGSGGAGDRP
jgi:hypothetical protein